ncbi:putative L,D-transpeptidase YkuD [Sporotomaculum syntrophicum]|uniref:L,D-transpeptidase YkuD n=1 Tax=Sporotomaculum syntrophicum TaxID=182264 RepID=A0A9D3AZH3_9FIRM|nr:L,D-transpeptidase family protein [Sporotomaculum syntrophicum]KAF1085843.1 putative L,D-transpeptidase YkuD [Sporotomaculum syntrophicum]
MATAKIEAGGHISINTTIRKLNYYIGERLIKVYPIAVGKPSTPTPAGSYKVKNKIVNPGGVLGTRWIGLTIPGGNYGIHGNNNPSSIGQAVSLGCIRMHNHHIEELFPCVYIGTPVHIYVRSEQVTTPAFKHVSGINLTGGSNRKTYTVRPGDTLWKIAKSFNVNLNQLILTNNITDPNTIAVGQTIFIP